MVDDIPIYKFKNADIDEMFAKVRKIRCMNGPRFSMYDKISKTQIYMDSALGFTDYTFHISWSNKKGDGKLGTFYPQAEFKEGVIFPELDTCGFWVPLKQALDMALTVARKDKLEEFKLIPVQGKYTWETIVKKI